MEERARVPGVRRIAGRIRQRLTYANVMSTIAVFAVLGGGSFAVAALSSHEKKVVKRIANKRITKRAPRLSVKHAGSADIAGHAYSTGFDSNNAVTLSSAGEDHTLMSLTVPDGSYVVTARLQGKTGNDGGGNDFRYDCDLSGGSTSIDDPTYRVGMTNLVEDYLTYEGAFTGSGPITLTCRSANGHTLTAQSGRMTAVKMRGLN
jgi:hypothetical protein